MTLKGNDDNNLIPMATQVEIVEEVENEYASANNPRYTDVTHTSAIATTLVNNPRSNTVPTHSSTIVTRNVTTLDVPSGCAVVPNDQSAGVDTRSRFHKNLGRRSTGLKCFHCNRETVTIVEDQIGVGTVIATVLLAMCFWPLCWIPFCAPSCKRSVHYCGHDSCRRKVGVTDVCA
jgi:hypothetical protein